MIFQKLRSATFHKRPPHAASPAHHRRLSSFATAVPQQEAQPGVDPVARWVAIRVIAELFSVPLIGDRAGDSAGWSDNDLGHVS